MSRWPLIVHLLSGCFCMGCSAVFHLVQIHSRKIYDIFSRLDYGGISVLVMGSCYPPMIYIFACEPVFWMRDMFLTMITVSSIICFIGTLHPIMGTPKLRRVRVLMFCLLGASAGIPFIYLANMPAKYEKYVNMKYEWFPWVLGGAIYIGTAIIYGLRIPEKWFPKTFDLCGSSHNIFHVGVVFAMGVHFNQSMYLYVTRKEMVCPV